MKSGWVAAAALAVVAAAGVLLRAQAPAPDKPEFPEKLGAPRVYRFR